MISGHRSRWEQLAGRVSGHAYAAHFARILDAGCGTGRVAVRLAELGYDTVDPGPSW